MAKLSSVEIARLAGVSRSTVSRVINGYSNVPPATQERVMRVIREHGYYPQLSGQLLAGMKSHTIGLFWVNSGSSIANDVQCSEFFAHICESVAEAGYVMLVCLVPNLSDEANIDKVKRLFAQGRIDAGLFIGVDNDEPLIRWLLSEGRIVGLFDYFHEKEPAETCVTSNFDADVGERVIDYVVGLGHRDVALLHGDPKRYSCVMREAGHLRGMKKHGVALRPEWIRYSGITEQEGYQTTKAMIAQSDRLPTVICANNDATAFGAYAALAEAGVSIPGQVSVIGADGHGRGAWMTPPMTTFAYDFRALFSSLVRRMVQVVEGDADVQRNEVFYSRLVERASCRRI